MHRVPVCLLSGLLVLACAGDPTSPGARAQIVGFAADSVRIEPIAPSIARLSDGSAYVRTGVRVTNLSRAALRLDVVSATPGGEGCGGLEFYRRSDYGGAPAWSGDQWQRQTRWGCLEVVPFHDIARGAVHDVPLVATVRDILGDSLPAGRYYARVAVHVRPAYSPIPARRLIFDAGRVDLPAR